jgi:hypothetical protein
MSLFQGCEEYPENNPGVQVNVMGKSGGSKASILISASDFIQKSCSLACFECPR